MENTHVTYSHKPVIYTCVLSLAVHGIVLWGWVELFNPSAPPRTSSLDVILISQTSRSSEEVSFGSPVDLAETQEKSDGIDIKNVISPSKHSTHDNRLPSGQSLTKDHENQHNHSPSVNEILTTTHEVIREVSEGRVSDFLDELGEESRSMAGDQFIKLTRDPDNQVVNIDGRCYKVEQ